jgi:cellobiose transport system substrate-binding protein
MVNKWSYAILAIVLVFSLAACSDTGTSTGTSEDKNEKVTLSFWVFGATGYEDLAKEYQKDHPNVTIKFKNAEFNDHHNSLFTSISAGSGAPDLTMIEVDQLDRYRDAEDRFTNLYKYDADKLKEQYLEWKWKIGESTDGSFLFGLPTDIGPKGFYYRVDLFEEAGLPTDPAEVAKKISTPEEFKQAALQVKENTGKPMVDSMEMIFRAKLDALETTYFDPEGNLLIENKGNGVREAYDYAVEMNALGVVGELQMWTPEWGNGVNEGEFAAELGAAWLKGWMSGNAPDAAGKFRVATLPQEFAGNWGGSYIAIPSETKHAQEAYNFAKWLVSPENQLKSFKSDGLFPSAPSVYEQSEFKESKDDYFGGQSTAQIFADVAQGIGYVYKGPDYVTANSEILNAMTNVQQQGADAEEEWQAAIKRIKDQISR